LTFFQLKSEKILIHIRVQPRSSRNQVAGLYQNALKIRLTAPPVDNAANKACLKFLARELGIAKSRLSIAAGASSRNKTILVSPETGKEKQAVLDRLDRLVP
jgi:uncharacterized protein (TIGR00251 family)